MAAGADGAQCAGHRHHAAGPAADRRQPRRREREPSAICDHRLHSGLRRRAAVLWPDLRPFRTARSRCSFGLVDLYRSRRSRRPLHRASPCCLASASSRASAPPRRASSRCRSSATCSAAARMAEVMSLVFMVFMVIPVIAPGVGQVIMLFSEWHMIFIFMAVGRRGDLDLDGAAPARNPAPRIPPAPHARLDRRRFQHRAAHARRVVLHAGDRR